MSIMETLFGATPGGMIQGGVQGLVDGLGNSVDKIIRDLKLPPEVESAAQVKLAELKSQTDANILQFQATMEQAYKDELVVINQTMQAEGKSEHWLQWSWRPLNGMTLALGSFAAVIFTLWAAYFAVIMHDAASLNALPAVITAITLVLGIPGAVCGVTAWHRGVAQIEQIKKA